MSHGLGESLPTDECRPRGPHPGSPKSKGRRAEKSESPLLRLGRTAVIFLPLMFLPKAVAASNSEQLEAARRDAAVLRAVLLNCILAQLGDCSFAPRPLMSVARDPFPL